MDLRKISCRLFRGALHCGCHQLVTVIGCWLNSSLFVSKEVPVGPSLTNVLCFQNGLWCGALTVDCSPFISILVLEYSAILYVLTNQLVPFVYGMLCDATQHCIVGADNVEIGIIVRHLAHVCDSQLSLPQVLLFCSCSKNTI